MNTWLFAVIVTAFGQVAAPAPYPAAGGDPTFRPAIITADKDIHVFAEAEGILLKLPVREGSRVANGQVLATIDDRQAVAAVEVAQISHLAALEQASDKVEEEFAIESAKYAKSDLQKDLEANLRSPGAVTDIQLEQKRLAHTRARLQIEKARKDLQIAAKEADVKKAELHAAKVALEHRTIRARFDGEVQQLFQKEGQWVNPGDPILQLVKFDVLRVECFVKAQDYNPVELAGRRVTVRVRLARDREASVTGRVVHVDQMVRPIRNDFLVRAEVQNQRAGDYWLIRPGLAAEMTIHVSEPAAEATPQSAALPSE